MTQTIIVAGGGHAAGQTIVSLRQGGFDGKLVLVGDEPYPPYQRPPLSKKFLAGEIDVSRLLLRQEKFYSDHDVDLLLGRRVEAVDRDRHSVRLGTGESLQYDRLVLATGSHARKVELPGSGLAGVHYLRTIEDVDRIRDHFRAGARLVIVGAGYIGLEVAAVAVGHGLDVTVLELADMVMARVEAPPVSAFMEQVHHAAGVRILCNTGISAFNGHNKLTGIVTSTGDELPADLAIVGVGVLPTTDLAEAAGLPCANGIVVDEYCRTADDAIVAVGDCTNHPNPLIGRRLRLESVHNAQEQGKTAAATLLGKLEPYAQIPWFWSDQYDLKLQIVGFSSRGQQAIVRGEPESRSFTVFFLDERGRLVAAYAINSAREFMLSKKLIAQGAMPDPARLADVSIPFKELAEQAES